MEEVPVEVTTSTTSSASNGEFAESDSTGKPYIPQDLLLLVFIHGFKGDDSTFRQFPSRLRHVLAETVKNIVVESVVFPAYETKGELNAAVVRFADWLTNLTVQREVAHGVGGGAGKAKIVLCGHSMGGLLAADSLIEFVRTRPDTMAPLWPNIVACLAFDTPYLGLHPHVFKNQANQAAGYIRSAHSLVSSIGALRSTSTPPRAAPMAAITAPPAPKASGGGWWAPAAYAVGGALLAGAAAGTAYWKREDINTSYTWMSDHMKYVGTLWEKDALKARVERLLEIESDLGVVFRTFYTYLPPQRPANPSPRTFIILPDNKASSHFSSHFLQSPNSLASDEISAHTGMFDAKTNDGYYELGLISAQLIRDVVTSLRDVDEMKGKVGDGNPLSVIRDTTEHVEVKKEVSASDSSSVADQPTSLDS